MADDAVAVQLWCLVQPFNAVPRQEPAFLGAAAPSQASTPPVGGANPGKDDEKAPKRGRKRKAEALQGCAAFSAGTDLANLDGARGSFTRASIDYRSACTATQDNTCQIVRHLPVWNEFLCRAHLELQETPGVHGQLSLSACQGVRTYRASRDEFEQAAALVYWLLKTHRCVAVLDIQGSTWNAHPAIVANALRDSPFVKSLTVSTFSLHIHSGLSEVISTLTQLREFECTGEVRFQVQLAASLPLLLQRAKLLASLRISSLRWKNRQTARDFFEALTAAPALNELSIHDSALAKLQCPKMAMHVMSTIAPSVLTLQLSSRPSQDCLYMCLLGLSQNQSISEVRLVNLRLDDAAGPIALVWRDNSVLSSFHMLSTQWDFADGYHNKCALALLRNETLEDITLPLHIWDDEMWALFFAALAQKPALRRVTIEVFFIEAGFMREVCDAIKASKVEDRVFFRDVRSKNLPLLIDFWPIKLEGSRLSELYAEPDLEVGRGRLSRLLQVLPSCGPVTYLDVPADLYCLEPTLMSALGDYIASTTTLRTFRVSAQFDRVMAELNTPPDWFWTIIAQALMENKSIRDLGLQPERISKEVANDLVNTVWASPNVCKVHFSTREKSVARAIVRGLSSGIAQDRRLIEVTLKDAGYQDLDRDWFAIQDVVGRNCRMVARAAQYVTGAVCDRYRARALEAISGHPVLVEEVATLASVSVQAAAARVQQGLRSFESMHDFMRLAGVVQERVVCHPRKDGRTQIDGLNEYSWAGVRRYLKLEDIRERRGCRRAKCSLAAADSGV